MYYEYLPEVGGGSLPQSKVSSPQPSYTQSSWSADTDTGGLLTNLNTKQRIDSEYVKNDITKFKFLRK